MALPPIDELIAALSDPDIGRRVTAVVGCASQGHAALKPLSAVLHDEAASELAKVWAINALGRIDEDDEGTAARALRRACEDGHPAVRWSALHTLGGRAAADAVALIAKSLSDDAIVESAWFEDDCRVSDAARSALDRIGTDEARSALEKHAAQVQQRRPER